MITNMLNKVISKFANFPRKDIIITGHFVILFCIKKPTVPPI